MNHSTSNEIITNRELNRAFSRAVQGCMIDGYDIDGKESESSWGHAHVVMVKSQRGQKDTYRVVELGSIVELGNCKSVSYEPGTPPSRVLEITEYKNAHDMAWKKNGDILSQRFFYRVGQDYGQKFAWTENKRLAIELRALHVNRVRNKSTLRWYRNIELTPANLLALTTLVRKHGDRCKCVAPRDIVGAQLSRNLYDHGPMWVNISVQRGKNGRTFDVCVAAKRTTDYSLTTPHNIAAASKLYGEKGKDRDYVICKLIENAGRC